MGAMGLGAMDLAVHLCNATRRASILFSFDSSDSFDLAASRTLSAYENCRDMLYTGEKERLRLGEKGRLRLGDKGDNATWDNVR
jgi:hypothetical protein